jgi:hypothetical protein
MRSWRATRSRLRPVIARSMGLEAVAEGFKIIFDE